MILAGTGVVTWLALQVIVNPGSPGAAPAQPEPRAVTQQISEASGVVDDIDRVGRNITIKSGGTLQVAIYVGPDLPIFDQLNRGDVVIIRFYDSVIVDVTPGARMGPPTITTADAQQAVDRERGDATVMSQTKITVTVDEIDIAARLVTYHGSDNRRVLRQVQHLQLIDGLKVGDVITITFTRARAAAIEKRQ
jgi:Cu/Ag efflux protein CusF